MRGLLPIVSVALCGVLFVGCGGSSTSASAGNGEYYEIGYQNESSSASSTGSAQIGTVDIDEGYGTGEIEPTNGTTGLSVGYLTDAPIANMRYVCGDRADRSGDDGKVVCPLMSEAAFYVGDTLVGRYFFDDPTEGKITVASMTGHPVWEVPMYDPTFVASMVLIRSSDSDGYSGNGIQIADTAGTGDRNFFDANESISFLSRFSDEVIAQYGREYAMEIEREGVPSVVTFDPAAAAQRGIFYRPGDSVMPFYLAKNTLDDEWFYRNGGEGATIAVVVPKLPDPNDIPDSCDVRFATLSPYDSIDFGFYGEDFNATFYASVVAAMCDPYDGSGFSGMAPGAKYYMIETRLDRDGRLGALADYLATIGADEAVVFSDAFDRRWIPKESEYNASRVWNGVFVYPSPSKSGYDDLNRTNTTETNVMGIMPNAVEVTAVGYDGSSDFKGVRRSAVKFLGLYPSPYESVRYAKDMDDAAALLLAAYAAKLSPNDVRRGIVAISKSVSDNAVKGYREISSIVPTIDDGEIERAFGDAPLFDPLPDIVPENNSNVTASVNDELSGTEG